jgi:hypothetical protein
VVATSGTDDNGMVLKRIGIVLVWLAATLGTATLTLAAVGRAGSEVSDRPAVPISGAELAARFASTTIAGVSTTQAGTTSEVGGTTTDGATTTVVADSAPTTATTVATTETASTFDGTVTTETSQTQTFEKRDVGRVTIKVKGPEVIYVSSVVLGSGYSVHLEDTGAESGRVVVTFEGGDAEFTFTARVVGGSLEAGFDIAHDD